MGRDLRLQLITKKRALHEKKHALSMEELTTEEALLHCSVEDAGSLETKLFELNSKRLAVEAALKRSYLFGQHFSSNTVPSLCIACYVDNNKESFMLEVESERGNGSRQFWCLMCRHVLHIAP